MIEQLEERREQLQGAMGNVADEASQTTERLAKTIRQVLDEARASLASVATGAELNRFVARFVGQIEVRGDGERAERVVGAVRVWTAATSLGGVESLIERRRRYPGESPLVPEQLLRLSVGIENVEDLWADLDQALRS